MKAANARRDLIGPNVLIICTSLRRWECSLERGAYVPKDGALLLNQILLPGKGLRGCWITSKVLFGGYRQVCLPYNKSAHISRCCKGAGWVYTGGRSRKVNEEITAPKLYNWRDSELKDQIPVLDNEDTGSKQSWRNGP
jgi:hypothetical protein